MQLWTTVSQQRFQKTGAADRRVSSTNSCRKNAYPYEKDLVLITLSYFVKNKLKIDQLLQDKI
jgi:hypothetical protein